jgi:hypothetical protein
MDFMRSNNLKRQPVLKVKKPVRLVRPRQPVVHQPVVHQPVVHQPVVHQSVVHEPVVHQPVVHEPVVHQPVVHEPVVHQPVVHEPVVNQENENALSAVELQKAIELKKQNIERERQVVQKFLNSKK